MPVHVLTCSYLGHSGHCALNHDAWYWYSRTRMHMRMRTYALRYPCVFLIRKWSPTVMHNSSASYSYRLATDTGAGNFNQKLDRDTAAAS